MPVIVTRHTKHSIITRGILKSSSSLVCKNILTASVPVMLSDIENLLPVISRPTIVLAANIPAIYIITASNIVIYLLSHQPEAEPDDKRTFHKFSLGMKQRLGIAAAIMENPDIIILDEPINALDDTGTEQIRDILIRHRERGALIIIACHDADELNFLSDEIIEIVQGQIKPSKDDKKSA